MFTSVLLAAAISLSASPAAYDNAAAHQSYQITVTSLSSTPMTIHATLAPDDACSVQLDKRPTWATLSGPAVFTLAAHASRKFIVSVGEPPPGKSELIAAFIGSDPSPSGGVHTNAGVGTAFRFSEPGQTVITPCPKPKPSKNSSIRTVYVAGNQAKPPSTGISPMLFGGTIGGVLLLLALGLGLRRYRPRLLKRGVHHS